MQVSSNSELLSLDKLEEVQRLLKNVNKKHNRLHVHASTYKNDFFFSKTTKYDSMLLKVVRTRCAKITPEKDVYSCSVFTVNGKS
jgi:hypothetical protein